VPRDPNAIFEIWTALRLRIPIITVTIPGAYDFEGAAAAFADLPKVLSSNPLGSPAQTVRNTRGLRGSTCSPMMLTRNKSESALTALQVLKERLPQESDITRIGQQIHERSGAA
jgi:hypothetical protein